MGIVYKQSLHNTIVTYIGFAIGAINTLFLYTKFMQAANYGLVQVVLSVSLVLTPILAFGVPNALVKFYSGFDNVKEQDKFLNFMLFLPLVFIIPVGLVSYVANESIGMLLSNKNSVVKGYIWHIFFVGMAMAYFEVFYAWARIHMKSIFGNFMKEVFCRIGQTMLLVLLWIGYIDMNSFLGALVGLYVLRMVIMKAYAFKLRMPKLTMQLPSGWINILKYSALIILGGSAAIVLIEVDKVMLNSYLRIENVAYFAVAGFIASTIAVPSRAMHQITYPLTATYLNTKNADALKELYKKSSLTLFIISGMLFLLIVINLSDLYTLIPTDYSRGFMIVFWVGLAKVYDALLGNNNAILYNSDYYRTILLFGVLLALMAIGFNVWLIPKFGLDGAALASFTAFFIYNSLKLYYVKKKFDVIPVSYETLKVLFILVAIGGIFYLIEFSFHPIINICSKSILMFFVYITALYKFKISEDVQGVLSNVLKKIKI